MKKLLTYALVIGTIAWSLGLGALVPATSAAYVPVAGDIIKVNGTDRPAVYVVGDDLKTYVFSTRNTYGTWYSDFSLLKNITQADFDAMTMGGNVTVRPGSLVKFDNSDNVYAALPGNKLCKVTSDADAKVLYGNDYAARVLLVQVSFVGNYTFDSACALNKDSKLPDGTLFNYVGSTTVYYVQNGQKKLVSNNAFVANSLGTAMIVDNVPTTMSFEDGVSIIGVDAVLGTIKLTNSSVTAPFTQSSKTDLIRQAFATKYGKSIAEISITIQQETDTHVRGSVKFGESVGAGGNFFAAKVNNEWVIVLDGNGQISCTLLTNNGFPASMMTDCSDN